MTERRFAFEPLERLIVVMLRDGELGSADRFKDGVKSIAKVCGVHPRQIYRWREIGMIAWDAERAAEKAGWVPYEVWPEILDEIIASQTRVCASYGCGDTFLAPLTGGSKRFPPRFCSDRCRNREKMRRHRGWQPPQPRVCGRAECGASFHPTIGHPKQRYCSARCARRESSRRYRAIPEVAERRREQQRQYHQDVRELAVKRRERYASEQQRRDEAA